MQGSSELPEVKICDSDRGCYFVVWCNVKEVRFVSRRRDIKKQLTNGSCFRPSANAGSAVSSLFFATLHVNDYFSAGSDA
jgi:hypothetical protein